MNPERHEEIAREIALQIWGKWNRDHEFGEKSRRSEEKKKHEISIACTKEIILSALSTLAAGYEAELANLKYDLKVALDHQVEASNALSKCLTGDDKYLALWEKAQLVQKEIAAKNMEIREFRAIDRHKDKDWGKWYALYHSKVDRIAELEKVLAAKDSENQHLAELVRHWGEAAKEKDREIQRLFTSLKSARILVEEWAAYAGDYFKVKHNLVGDLAELDAALGRAAQSPALPPDLRKIERRCSNCEVVSDEMYCKRCLDHHAAPPAEEELERIAEGLMDEFSGKDCYSKTAPFYLRLLEALRRAGTGGK